MINTKLFIPYELAVIAKEKGFSELCFALITSRDIFPINISCNDTLLNSQITGQYNFKPCVPAPMYQQIIDWLRIKHNLIVTIELDQTSNIKWAYDIVKYNGLMDFERKTDLNNYFLYRDYYEAINQAIAEALKLI